MHMSSGQQVVLLKARVWGWVGCKVYIQYKIRVNELEFFFSAIFNTVVSSKPYH
jgi:hypothetical protein